MNEDINSSKLGEFLSAHYTKCTGANFTWLKFLPRYGSLVTLARTLGRKDIARELKKTLEEEKETDALLTSIAEASINKEASEEPVDVK